MSHGKVWPCRVSALVERLATWRPYGYGVLHQLAEAAGEAPGPLVPLSQLPEVPDELEWLLGQLVVQQHVEFLLDRCWLSA